MREWILMNTENTVSTFAKTHWPLASIWNETFLWMIGKSQFFLCEVICYSVISNLTYFWKIRKIICARVFIPFEKSDASIAAFSTSVSNTVFLQLPYFVCRIRFSFAFINLSLEIDNLFRILLIPMETAFDGNSERSIVFVQWRTSRTNTMKIKSK